MGLATVTKRFVLADASMAGATMPKPRPTKVSEPTALATIFLRLELMNSLVLVALSLIVCLKLERRFG